MHEFINIDGHHIRKSRITYVTPVTPIWSPAGVGAREEPFSFFIEGAFREIEIRAETEDVLEKKKERLLKALYPMQTMDPDVVAIEQLTKAKEPDWKAGYESMKARVDACMRLATDILSHRCPLTKRSIGQQLKRHCFGYEADGTTPLTEKE